MKTHNNKFPKDFYLVKQSNLYNAPSVLDLVVQNTYLLQ